MAESGGKPIRRGGRYCVAGAPNKQSCKNTSYTPGIKMHQFPTDAKVRAQWVKFVQRHRVDFGEPVNKHSALCSAHFEPSCYSTSFGLSLEGMEEWKRNKVLIKGSIPTKHTVLQAIPEEPSDRKRRQLRRDVLSEFEPSCAKRKKRFHAETSTALTAIDTAPTVTTPAVATATVSAAVTGATDAPAEESGDTCMDLEIPFVPTDTPEPMPTPSTPSSSATLVAAETPLTSFSTPSLQPDSGSCTSSGFCGHKEKCERLTRTNKRLKRKITELKQDIKKLKSKIPDTESENETTWEPQEDDQDHYTWFSTGPETTDSEPVKNENDWDPQGDTTESEATEEIDNDEVSEESSQRDISIDPDTPEYDEPKFIVFYRMLLSLFTLFCFNCKWNSPSASMRQDGTMVTVTQSCLHCNKEFVWRSQPLILGKYPAGNILLSFGVLMAGASINKILLVFRHMGLCVYSARTFFRHQKSFLFPIVLHYWETYRAALIQKLKGLKEVAWSGDGRFDSMGHSAKYGVYTMFCTTLMKIVHFELVQANEAGNSPGTEVEGAKRCFQYLQQLGLSISIFVSDRHRSIAKWVRENCPNTVHYYDIWHIARSVSKKLLGASKNKGCEVIKDWIKGVRRHIYWCATSTKAGFQALIIAKWKSFIRHVSNKHSNHPDELYKECNHGVLEPRRWIKVGTLAYDKLSSLLYKTALVNDIKKLSPDAQTSCLEGFHATLNYWHPKLICYSWMGSLCRHILAILHFNENIHRETQVSKDGKEYIRVTYPKFKLGEEVVREVASPPTYGYVDKLKHLLFTLPKCEMEKVLQKYSAKTPEPLNRQFPDRLSKEEAVLSFKARKQKKKTSLFPSSAEQSVLQQNTASSSSRGRKTSRRGRPRKK
ncbi:hypothetical protein ACROYT_G023277 [Oculina patagonica]